MEGSFWNKYKIHIISSLASFILGVSLTSLIIGLSYDLVPVNQTAGEETSLQEEVQTVVEEVPEKIEDKTLESAGIQDIPQPEIYSRLGIDTENYEIKDAKVRKNQFFANILSDYGVPQNDIYNLTQTCKRVFDTRKFKVGNAYKAYVSRESGRLDYFAYEQDAHTFVFFILKDTLGVEIVKKEFQTQLKYSEITIENSLWMDVQASGASPLLAIKMADIYAWTIDFFGLQPGDSFKTLYEEISYKGEVLDIGRVLYAEFSHLNEISYAYYFEEDGKDANVYWNEKGESLRKAFLKAPLNYTRISSGFSYHRKHPITRKVTPHTGVDYAAPMGTPVMSIGDGVVTYCGYKGPNGNMVKIKHNSVYQSAYVHLSKFGKGIKKGTRVKQGQVIGYVGSTGRSTGPHLDFRIWKNGTPINPLKMKSPPAEPVADEHMERFEETKKETLELIDDFKAQEFIDMIISQY